MEKCSNCTLLDNFVRKNSVIFYDKQEQEMMWMNKYDVFGSFEDFHFIRF